MSSVENLSHARVNRLWRYPVKSMAGESAASTEVSWHGVRGDRRWAFVQPDHEAHGFPYQTIREEPRMCLYAARLRDPSRPDASMVDVRTPEGADLEVTDPSLPEMLGDALQLIRLHRGLFDSMPLSLIGTATVRELCGRTGMNTDARRFRPNLLVDTTEPFVEDTWVGATVRIADTVMRIDRRDPRCIIVNVDPETARPESEMLRLITNQHRARAGVYASVVTPGTVHMGDPLEIEGETTAMSKTV